MKNIKKIALGILIITVKIVFYIVVFFILKGAFILGQIYQFFFIKKELEYKNNYLEKTNKEESESFDKDEDKVDSN